MREPIREPTPQEQRTGRGPEPLRYTGPAPVGEAMPYSQGGLVEWAPTWGGMFVSLGVLFLIGALGVAIGVSSGATGVAIWGAISVIIGFFVGGWFCGRTLNYISPLVSAAHGLLVWAVATVFAIAFTLIMALVGASSVAAALRTVFPAGLVVPSVSAPGAAAAAVTSSWVTFIILLLGVAACIIGSVVGNQSRQTGVVSR
ncbi:MAG TPA: hypothetical protein VKX96_08065 [Chloroflexota bacterium]|nr:hypothetical protein [Chloroflexota bacterium]